jgi:pyruvate,water dikinase
MGTTTDSRPVAVAPLAEFGSADLPAVGGKAANLGELMRAGLPVPDGFVLTTDAYAQAAQLAGLQALVTDPTTTPAALREAILSTGMPKDIIQAVTAAYRRLGDNVPVAVRSSATAEDLPGAAVAGQQDTYLNVVGAGAVLDAVGRCWASLFTDRAVDYRRQRLISPEEVRIAVVVQVMVESDTAGVMFTADPLSGARDRILIDAGAGLGEAVVSGLVTPDHYVLETGGKLLEWKPGRGEVAIRPTAGGGVAHEAATRDAAPAGGTDLDGALLTAEDLASLAGHARTIAEHFGRPQDIEWAIAAGKTWIVQARPMTALPEPTAPLGRFGRLQGAILAEYFPVRPYPLDMTTQVAHGPAEMMREIAHHFGLEGAFTNYLREQEGVVVALVPPSPRPTPRMLLTPAMLARKARRFKPANWSADPRQAAFLAEVDALESLELAALPWATLLDVPARAMATQDYCRDLRIDYLPGSGLALARLVVLTAVLGRRTLVADLLGGAKTRTEDSNRALARLADELRADPQLRGALTGLDAEQVSLALSRDPRLAGFAALLEAFLDEFGRRETTSPLLVSPPTLAESPQIVLGMALSLAGAPAADAAADSRSATALENLLEHRLLRGPRPAKLARAWVQAAREAVAFREDTHFYFTAALPVLRRSLLQIGARLQAAGVLHAPEGVFHLRWEELTGIFDAAAIPAGQAERLRAAVRSRTAKRAELAGVPMFDASVFFPAAAASDAVATGTPAGSGTATGVARIIRDAADFERLGHGEILVCPYTNPAWTPLFRRAAAVVVDTGSVASHAAIVAREYGIPAVMGTGNGTAVISDGENVTVDGTRGRITRAAQAAATA